MAESVIVAVRIRPLNSKEKKEKCTEIQTISGQSITITKPNRFFFIFYQPILLFILTLINFSTTKKTFSYDYVYGTKTTQDVWLLFIFLRVSYLCKNSKFLMT